MEQKNGAIVRHLVGYDRFQGLVATRTLGRLFDTVRLYVNFFQPSFKLREKVRDGAKVTRRYYPPATPCDRLLANENVSDDIKNDLRLQRTQLDPVKLLKELREAQTQLAQIDRSEFTEGKECESLDEFLAGLPDLWKDGEARPTHKNNTKTPRTWRTRKDPFDEVWSEVLGWLEAEPDITTKALFERLRSRHPEEFKPGQLRTLQRRTREWRRTMAERLILSYGRSDRDQPTSIH